LGKKREIRVVYDVALGHADLPLFAQ